MSAARAGVKPAEGRDLWAELAAPFPADHLELLPKPTRKENPPGACARPDRNGLKCGGWHGLPAIHLHYIGHAGVTGRLNQVDPTWTWEPAHRMQLPPDVLKAAIETRDPGIIRQVMDSAPPLQTDGGMWIKLTIPALGVTRLGFGDAQGKTGPNATKEIIGDALRNAAMRFGVGLYLWSKSEAAAAILERGEAPDPADPPRPPAPRAPEGGEHQAPDGWAEDAKREKLLADLGAVCEEYGIAKSAVADQWVSDYDVPITQATDLKRLAEFIEETRRRAAMDASKAGARS